MIHQSLDGPWEFRLHGKPAPGAPRNPALKQWISVTTPGTVHHALHAQGHIADPHFGRNELDLQWIDEQDWEWKREFHVPPTGLEFVRQELVFDGLDTVATIFLNGKQVGQSANMFRQVVCDVGGVLRPSNNELRIRFNSPTRYARQQAEAGGHRVADGDWKWQTGEVRPTWRAWIRKTQCHFGWDWGLYLATCGVWQSARLECADGPRIEWIKVRQEFDGSLDKPRAATLHLTLGMHAAASSAGTIRVRCGDEEATTVFSLDAGDARHTATLHIPHPTLWWPAGEGAQHLYDLACECLDTHGQVQSSITRRIGLRTVELVTQPDQSPDGQPAETFYFKVNGRPIYAKGANWIPPDQFVDRCTPDVYRHLLSSMVDANMNMIRVWGGGWYEQDIFYDLCDELGLMVWQDFMMACALYPDTPSFIDELRQEAIYQVRRLHARPSVILWNGDNEDAEAVWRWWKDSPDFPKNVEIYKTVMTELKRVVEFEDDTRRFWLSSPSNNDFNGDCTNPNRGDVHYWTVWHGKQPFSNYLTVKPRFASEFGFQSFPEPRTIRACVPEPELNPSSRIMEHHQRSPEGNMLITNTMAREMRIPRDFDMFCWVSQINQAMAIKTAVEHWRRLRPWCMGTLYWQINDLWPVASWSSIDYQGRWKVLHHFAKRFYSPLLGSIVANGDEIELWATSDLPRPLPLQGTLDVFTWAGRRLVRRPLTTTLRAGESRRLLTLPRSRLLPTGVEPHEVCLFLDLQDKKDRSIRHENFATLVPWKWITLPRPQTHQSLDVNAGSLRLTAQSNVVTPFFHAELTGLEGHFEGDWQILRPDRSCTLRWIPHVHRGAAMPSQARGKKLLRSFSLYDTYEH